LTTTGASISELAELDDILDGGNLATGLFRLTPHRRCTNTIEDRI